MPSGSVPMNTARSTDPQLVVGRGAWPASVMFTAGALHELIAHLLWCKARAQAILYSLDRIEAHEKMVLQYFQD